MQIFILIILFLCGLTVIQSSLLLVLGMLPTIIISIFDKSEQKIRGVTVGCMNFAGVFPYWFDLITNGHTFTKALEIITNPGNFVIIYICAGVGYVLEWVVAYATVKLKHKNGQKRMIQIDKIQKELEERWGKEVTGKYQMDKYGFAVEKDGPPSQDE